MGGLSEGRIVHYVNYSKKHLAAVVIGFDREKECEKPVKVDLAIFSGTGKASLSRTSQMADFFDAKAGEQEILMLGLARLVRKEALQFQSKIPFNSDKVPGTWHWVER